MHLSICISDTCAIIRERTHARTHACMRGTECTCACLPAARIPRSLRVCTLRCECVCARVPLCERIYARSVCCIKRKFTLAIRTRNKTGKYRQLHPLKKILPFLQKIKDSKIFVKCGFYIFSN
jgi:hypothetical protein